ncbi:MAG: hypothetical protein LAQ69_17375 [Acidobacteriia bacterium]|nr:hypothetical protein [Terriglobia bacterium]
MTGANRAYVRNLRKRRFAAYFAYWQAIPAKFDEQLHDSLALGLDAGEWLSWVRGQWRRARAAYPMIRLAVCGVAYRLGAQVNPGPSLERIAQLLGGTIGDSGQTPDRL